MPPVSILPIALFVAGVGSAVLAYWVRRNDATTATTLDEVRALARRVDKVHQTLYGPNDDNGLNGDNAAHKRRLHRADGFIAAVCLTFGMECDEQGAVRWLPGVSAFERRFVDRRKKERRRGVERRITPDE